MQVDLFELNETCAEHLEISVNQPVRLEVVVVLPKRVDQLLRDLQPPGVEEELQQGEDGNVQVQVVTRVALTRIQELTTDQTHQEETVNCQRHNLRDRGQSEALARDVTMV